MSAADLMSVLSNSLYRRFQKLAFLRPLTLLPENASASLRGRTHSMFTKFGLYKLQFWTFMAEQDVKADKWTDAMTAPATRWGEPHNKRFLVVTLEHTKCDD